MKWELIPTEKIKPLEYVFPNHLKNLENQILSDNVLKEPLIIDNKHFIVLDGSHRHIILLKNGFKYTPVILVDYDNPHIRVGTHRIHRLIIDEPVNISKKEVINRGRKGDLFPPRTTRHFFPFLRPKIEIPLEKLEKIKPVDVSKNIAQVDIKYEILNNKQYINEIDEETEQLIHYLEENIHIKKYLLKQVVFMEENE